MIKANDPQLKSWVAVPANSDFPIQNLPFGIYSSASKSARVGVAIGDHIVDTAVLAADGLFNGLGIDASVWTADKLNPLMAYGKKTLRAVREKISEALRDDNATYQNNEQLLDAQSTATMHMPVQVGDYTDFYSSIEHATNLGKMFRDPANALLPNWLHIPVGYHGRSSSIIPSDTAIRRPKGQSKPADSDTPVYGACKLLDFELEVAFVTFDGKPMGESIKTAEADDYIFGLCLFNDWSARDIQKWEYVPLGPFLGKNFASCVSPWIVTLDALEPFRVSGPVQDPKVLPYLEYEGDKNIDLNLEVIIQPEGAEENSVSKSNFKYMYWNMNQQLAHHTVNGCNVRCGDMMASGTISGPEAGSYGSMLEIAWQGTKPITLKDGSQRKSILDHDTVIMRGHCEKNGVRVGFGEVSTKVLPAV